MIRGSSFTLYILFFSLINVCNLNGQATVPFVTTWKTDNMGTSFNNQITIPTLPGEIYNYTVDWGDGTFMTTETGNATHTYASAGTYTVRITGLFPGIYFGGYGDELKLLSIEQWGDNKWLSMQDAFEGCENLQSNFTDSPDLSNVTNMSGMFFGVPLFNQDISGWDVSHVTNMSRLFGGTKDYQSSFNQDISGWDVSQVTNMSGMFSYATSFNQDISSWNVSQVTDMSFMFYNTELFNQDISGWDVSQVIDMGNMFKGARSFNQDISGWDVSQVTNSNAMFYNAKAFNQDIGNWDVSQVTNMNNMFSGAVAFNQDIGNWDVSNVVSMSSMFSSATIFNQDIGNWDVSSVVNMDYMFSRAIVFNQDIGNWDVSQATGMNGMFHRATLFNQDISSWNVSQVTNMEVMFSGAEVFNKDIGGWDVSHVTNMEAMFSSAKAFNQDISGWDVGHVIDMSSMFSSAEVFNQDIGGWDVSHVIDMEAMFFQAILFNQYIGGWDVSKVEDLSYMFYEAGSFNQDIGYWDVGQATNMEYMFNEAKVFNQDISSWDVSHVSNMEAIFSGAKAFNQDIGAWDVGQVTNMEYMFSNVELSVDNYDALLIGWSSKALQPNILFTGGNSKYCAGEQAREAIRNTQGWTITDGGKEISPKIYDKVKRSGSLTFTLPSITGTSLTGNQRYYTGPNGTGTSYEAGDIIHFNDYPSYPITLYMYDRYKLGCATEESFELEIRSVPKCTTLTSPLAGAIGVLPTIDKISWNSVSTATGYKLSIGTSLGATDILSNEDVGKELSYHLTTSLPENTLIYVRITPSNSEGNAEGGECPEESFTTGEIILVPECPQLTTPLAGDQGVAVDTNIEWTSVPGATKYKLSIGTSSGATDILSTKDVGNELSYHLTTNLPENTLVYVQITSYNSDGDPVDCASETFTTVDTTTVTSEYLPPKFFTPNNDSKNDYWIVPNPENQLSSVFIYNRYGKLLKQIADISRGWDGTFNGSPVSANEYWYIITYKDGKVLNGHFSLVR